MIILSESVSLGFWCIPGRGTKIHRILVCNAQSFSRTSRAFSLSLSGKSGAPKRGWSVLGPFSETGRMRFRRARFQTPSSVSFFGPERVPGRELSELLSAYYLWAKANSPSLSQNSPSLPQNSVRLSEFSSLKQYFCSRNSIPPVS